MKVVKNELVFPVDVDDTLIIYDGPNAVLKDGLVTCPYLGTEVKFRKHEPHIQLLKEKKIRGHFIIVWSAGGHDWAKAVIEALDISEYVDLVLTKPKAYLDDKTAEEWMTERIYLSPDSAWKKGVQL